MKKEIKWSEEGVTYVIQPRQIRRLEIMFACIISVLFMMLVFMLFVYAKVDSLNLVSEFLGRCG